LSSTEAEIASLSYVVREMILMIELLKEIWSHGHIRDTPSSYMTKVHCKVFKDNIGAIEIAKFPKYRPWTKHLNIRLFHFWGYVDQSEMTIHKIKSKDQPADVLMKLLSDNQFIKHWKWINGW
jgi:hypothetical protein